MLKVEIFEDSGCECSDLMMGIIFKSSNRCKLLNFFYTFFTVFRGIGIRKIFWFFFQNVFFFEKILFFFKIFIFQIFFSQYKNCHFWKKIIIFETKIVIFETKISFSNKNFIFQTKLSFFWQKSLFLRQKVWSKIQKLSFLRQILSIWSINCYFATKL